MILYDVIMPTYNQTELTVQCVRSLARMKEAEHTRLIWIDNGSADNHILMVEDACIEYAYPTLLAHLVDENLGFTKATNLGIALSTAPYVVFLNNDVILYSGVFDIMREAIEKTDRAMLACTTSTSGWQTQERLEKRGWLKQQDGDIIPAVKTPRLLERAEHPAYFCTMITRECIQKIGYLSEEMGAGFGEDDDYNERIHAAGYRRLICLDAFVRHEHRSTWKSLYSDDEIRAMQQQSMDVLQKKYGEKVW